MNTTGTVKGFDELMKAMDELSQEISQGKTARIWKNCIGYAMQPVKETAKMLIDAKTHGTGTLADSVYLAVHKPTARDKRSGSYMGEMYMARVSIKSARPESRENISLYTNKKGQIKERKSLTNTNRPVAMAVEFGTANVASRPVMRPALEANINIIQQRLATALWRELTMGKYAKEAGKDFTGSI